jgi:hypothetical protein
VGAGEEGQEKRTKLAVLVVAQCHEAVVMPHTRCRHPMFSFLAHACCCISWFAASFSREMRACLERLELVQAPCPQIIVKGYAWRHPAPCLLPI